MSKNPGPSKEDALRSLQELLRELSPARVQEDLDLAAKMVGVLLHQESEAVPDPSPEHVADVELPHQRTPAHQYVARLLLVAMTSSDVKGPDGSPFRSFLIEEGREPYARILAAHVHHRPDWPGKALHEQAMADTYRALWNLFLPGLTVRQVQTGAEPKYELWCGISQGRAYLRNFREQGLLKEAENRKFYLKNQQSEMAQEQGAASSWFPATELSARRPECARCANWVGKDAVAGIGDCLALGGIETTQLFHCAHFTPRWPGDGEVAP